MRDNEFDKRVYVAYVESSNAIDRGADRSLDSALFSNTSPFTFDANSLARMMLCNVPVGFNYKNPFGSAVSTSINSSEKDRTDARDELNRREVIERDGLLAVYGKNFLTTQNRKRSSVDA
jgi:hypothetical protein